MIKPPQYVTRHVRAGLVQTRSFFPFTDYDFWAYISSGFVFLFALDHSLQLAIFQRPTWTVVEGLIAVAVAYAVGHLLAGCAAAILERRFVRQYLGRPSLLLLGVREGPKWFQYVNPEFYEPLPKAIIDKILAKARTEGITEPGEALFWLAYDHIRQKKFRHARVSTFLNLYGLCQRSLMATPQFITVLGDTSVLVASHHGRQSGWCDELRKYCNPYYVVISDKGYMHDSQETVPLYRSIAKGGPFRSDPERRVLTTRNDGRIGFAFTGQGWNAY